MIIGGELFGEDQGIRNVNYFKHSTLSWQPMAMMLRARWYPTLVPLSNGDMLAVEGQDATGEYMDVAEKFSSNAWTLVPAERFDEETQQLVLFDSDNYPLMFAIHDAADNMVFWAGKRRRNDTTQEGLRSHLLNLSSGQPQYTPTGGNIPTEGSGAVLWIDGTSPVKKGKVIKVGGNGLKVDVGVPEPYFLASDAVRQFDLDADPHDQWTSLSNLNAPATDCNMVLLPNGKLLVVGAVREITGTWRCIPSTHMPSERRSNSIQRTLDRAGHTKQTCHHRITDGTTPPRACFRTEAF